MDERIEVHEKENIYSEDKQRLRLNSYLKQMFETGASDLHIKPLKIPRLRINNDDLASHLEAYLDVVSVPEGMDKNMKVDYVTQVEGQGWEKSRTHDT